MTIALRLADSAPTTRAQPAAAIAQVEVYDDMLRAEPLWRTLEARAGLATPYQRFDFLAPWQREVGARHAVTPVLVVGFDIRGEPVLLCPFGRRSRGPVAVAEFLGGKHANFNMPLWRRDVAGTIGRADLDLILAALPAGLDLLALRNQPESWGGIANPFRLLPHQPSPSFGQRGALMADFEALLRTRLNSAARKKLRKKERVLSGHGALSFRRIATAEEACAVLAAFFSQKAERMRRLGVANAFEGPGVREFITAAATERLASGEPAIELYACTVGERVVATFAGLGGRDRFCGLFNSMVLDSLAHESPSELLLTHVVRMCCERGLAIFDLGVGEAPYKRVFCDQGEPLFDSFLPLSPRGRLAALGARAQARAKRLVKQNAALWRAVDWMRRRRGRLHDLDA
jgi:CelD/BcsL family acetyltransferase involved in cellulose biosynthesis